MDEHDDDRIGRVLPFKRPGPPVEPSSQEPHAAAQDQSPFDPREVGPRELRVVVENFLGILDSLDLYVQQTRSLATLWLKGGEPDAGAVNQIVANCEQDTARLADIRASYRRLADTLDETEPPR